MIIISDSAKERLLYLLGKKGENNEFVRVGVESGGCSGLSYKLDFDNTKTDDDELIEDNGISLLINKKSSKSRPMARVSGISFIISSTYS